MIRIVEATQTENKDTGWKLFAKAGDQTGTEVHVRDWYSNNWNLILRHPNPEVGERAAAAALTLADSTLVGYDQRDRNTLYQELEKNNWSVDEYIFYGNPSEVDCSSLIYAVYSIYLPEIRGLKNAPATFAMKNMYQKWGFDAITAGTKDKDRLRVGDILVNTSSHAAIVVETNQSAMPVIRLAEVKQETKEETKVSHATNLNKEDRGKYYTTAILNVRKGAGTDNEVIVVIPNHYAVNYYGYYSKDKNGTKWYAVQFNYRGKDYTGYVSSDYLTKQ